MPLNLAGRDLTVPLQNVFNQLDDTFTISGEQEIVRDVKEKLSYFALDFEAQIQKTATTTDWNVSYTLSDRNEILIANERFQYPELLFKPSFNGFEFDGIDQTLFDSIMKCDVEFGKDLDVNIVLSGGITMFQELPECIEKEIIRLASATMKIKVVVPPERKYAVWISGSILASLATFPQMFIVHEEYNDTEPGIVHRKCFETAEFRNIEFKLVLISR
jgi:actin